MPAGTATTRHFVSLHWNPINVVWAPWLCMAWVGNNKVCIMQGCSLHTQDNQDCVEQGGQLV